jgi:hypothetical protein
MRSNPKLSTETAAELFDLTTAQLLNYRRRIDAKGKKFASTHVRETVKGKYKHLTMFTASTLKVLMDRYKDGEVSRAYCNEILNEFSDRLTRLEKNLADWKNRFEKVEQVSETFKPPYQIHKSPAGIVMKPQAN